MVLSFSSYPIGTLSSLFSTTESLLSMYVLRMGLVAFRITSYNVCYTKLLRKKLDIRRRQVYVEALIMEVNLDNARDLGVEFRAAGEFNDSGAVLGGTNFDFAGNLNELLTGLATGNPLLFTGTGLLAAGIAGNVTLPDGTEIPAITAVLRAAQTANNVNIVITSYSIHYTKLYDHSDCLDWPPLGPFNHLDRM